MAPETPPATDPRIEARIDIELRLLADAVELVRRGASTRVTLGGLVIALALNGRGFAGSFYKSLFYLPICLSLVVIGQVWIWVQLS